MKLRRIALALALSCGVSLPALAAPATSEQAAKISSGIEAYIGKTPGVVTVTPSGEQYEIKLDFAPLFAKGNKPDMKVEMSPVVMMATDQGGGKWQVNQDQALSLSVHVDKALDLTAKFGAIKSTSTYDEAIGAFTQSATDVTDMIVDETFSSPEGAAGVVNYKLKSMHYELSAVAAGAEAIDGKFSATFEALEETFSMPIGAGAPPTPIKITAVKGTQAGDVKGMKLAPLKSILAFVIANASQDTLKGKEAEVRKMLNEAMPLFGSLATDATMEQLTVETPFGPVGINKAGVKIGMNGVVAAGEFSEGLTLEGLTLPPGLVPPFAVDLVPEKFAVDIKLSDFNLADAAAIFINEADWSKDKQSPEFDAKLLEAVIPSGAVTISTSSTGATAKVYDLSISGAMKAGPAAPPNGKATVKMKGLDEVVKAISAAPPEMGLQQAVAAILLVKGFGKADGDGLTWEIDAAPGGAILVNGVDVSKLGGAPAQ